MCFSAICTKVINFCDFSFILISKCNRHKYVLYKFYVLHKYVLYKFYVLHKYVLYKLYVLHKYVPYKFYVLHKYVLYKSYVLIRQMWANSADPDQTALEGAIWSGFTLFAIPSAPVFGQMGESKQWRPRSDCSQRSSLIRVYTVCNSISIFWIHYWIYLQKCSSLCIIKIIISGVSIFFHFCCNLKIPVVQIFLMKTLLTVNIITCISARMTVLTYH